MTKQEHIDILERLDRIIELLENKNKSCEPLTTFVKANNVENTFIQDRQRELFQALDAEK